MSCCCLVLLSKLIDYEDCQCWGGWVPSLWLYQLCFWLAQALELSCYCPFSSYVTRNSSFVNDILIHFVESWALLQNKSINIGLQESHYLEWLRDNGNSCFDIIWAVVTYILYITGKLKYMYHKTSLTQLNQIPLVKKDANVYQNSQYTL